MGKKTIDQLDINTFLSTMEKFFGDTDVFEITWALEWAVHAHEGQMRKYEGIPYITHPMAVAVDVAKKYNDKELVLAALLHDIVEDCDVRFQDVYERYWKAVGYMVEAVSKAPLFFIDEPEVVYGDKIEKLLAGWMNDVRVLLLKIADRDHNLKSLEWLKPNKQIRMTFETQAIYEPLKAMMRCTKIKNCSESLSAILNKRLISSPSEFKSYLFTNTYNNLDNDSFELAYKNTDKIIRQIENKSWFESLLENEHFSNNIKIISMEWYWDKFSAKFRFIWWSILHSKYNLEITPSNFVNYW